jgi:hypothetical protein
MSNPSSTTPEDVGPPKKAISPARNIIGVLVLIAVVAVGVLQYSQLMGFNAAAGRLQTRFEDETKDLMTEPEVDQLLGKAPDGPGSDYDDGNAHYTRTTYTWSGLLKSYTLAAYYTKQKEPKLHHYETEGTKLAPPPAQKPIIQSPGKRTSRPDAPKKYDSPPSAGGKSKTDGAKPADSSSPVDAKKPADSSKPADAPKPADSSKPSDTPKPADSSKPAPDTAPPKDPK